MAASTSSGWAAASACGSPPAAATSSARPCCRAASMTTSLRAIGAGTATVAYIPSKGKVVGLSKISRVVDAYARRLQVQERVTTQVADAVEELLAPKGVAVLMEGIHLCMAMRGVQKQNSSTTTSAMRGLFRSDPRTRAEFMSAVQVTLRGR